MLEEKNKDIINEIGDCLYSVQNTVDALREGDCMCIGLSISRPEAAVADASRLVIKNIFPTYMTAESFLNSAKFNLESDSNAHGGFGKEKQGKLAMGQARESINGVMPLFLFKEHWSIARRKIQPIFGMMCTLDVMGFTQEQLNTIPFLVYLKALEKVKTDESEVTHRIFNQIQTTCIEIINSNKNLREEVIQKVTNFVEQPQGESARTSDVVKSVLVLAAQLYCLFLSE